MAPPDPDDFPRPAQERSTKTGPFGRAVGYAFLTVVLLIVGFFAMASYACVVHGGCL